ncbi:MAG: chorismate mutase [Acidobacteria bacterium]|nr:chorismate mutase [Acidobacteriota bacterium]
MRELSDWRRQIDALDRDLVELLNRRAEIVLQLAPLKRENRIEVFDPERERAVHENLRRANRGPLPSESVEKIFDAVMAAMRELQKAPAGSE